MPSSLPDSLACMILAAGEGRRLRPFTATVPKPLLTILDRPIVNHLLERVSLLGDIPVFLNLHHAHGALERHLAAFNTSRLVWRTESSLTGPAGALRLFLDDLSRFETIVVLSGDVIFSEPLDRLISTHRASGADLTFAVTQVTDAHRFGVLELDSTGGVVRAREKPDVPPHELHWISSGIYCLESKLLADIPPEQTFDFAAHLAPALIAADRPVQAHRMRGYWNDLGLPSSLRQANLDAATGRLEPGVEGGIFVGEGVQIGPRTEIVGPAVLGQGSVIGPDSWIENSVLLPGSVIPPGTVMIDGIAGPRWNSPERW